MEEVIDAIHGGMGVYMFFLFKIETFGSNIDHEAWDISFSLGIKQEGRIYIVVAIQIDYTKYFYNYILGFLVSISINFYCTVSRFIFLLNFRLTAFFDVEYC